MRGAAAVFSAALIAGCSGSSREARLKDAPSIPSVESLLEAVQPGPKAVLETSAGEIVVRLFPEEAPKSVKIFTSLAKGELSWRDPATGRARSGPLYDGLHFFRVIPGFMIQTGDPINEGHGRAIEAFEDEIHPNRSFDKPGMVALANSGPDTNGSQFFITTGKASWLNGKHTIIGQVVSGLDVARSIARTPRVAVDPATGQRIDRPKTPQILKKVRIEEP